MDWADVEWANFFATLVATALGAGVGLGGVLWTERRRDRQAYEAAMRSVSARVVLEANAASADVERWRSEAWAAADRDVREVLDLEVLDTGARLPSSRALHAAVGEAMITAHESDLAVFAWVRDTCYVIDASSPVEGRADGYEALADVVVRWRTRRLSTKYACHELQSLGQEFITRSTSRQAG
ncbi:hypothetical protein ACIPJ2_16140 [Curtobacterium sp. NPDC090217]|uniref:hypothetical protein n=1 Tax=Curtobacterium sp. NPDC090217 TaxID=3363970 RepID=UPI0038075777